MADPESDALPPVRELSRPQRRVLGTLLEKGFTTPEQYPLTLKATTTGCNQKNNRDPVSNYSEDQVVDVLDELQRLGLTAVVHTESGRTERYRHYMRKRFTLSEPQLAILTELMLRGRQSVGELRGRAGRMVPIETLEDLRREVQGLIDAGYVQADGPLDRRGVEVDHTFYPPGEKRRMEPTPIATESEAEIFRDAPHAPVGMPAPVGDAAATAWKEVAALRTELQSVRGDLAELRDRLASLADVVDDLRRQLGG